MHTALPTLSALRAFEAAARHLSLTHAARELSVTPGALSHQIRGLEDFLGTKLFERRVRSIALTTAGRQLYPGLQTGFAHIREAVQSLDAANAAHVLVVSTSPGLTSKWLAPRLYRFGAAYPDIDVRISSSAANANFATDGVDLAVRNMPIDAVSDSSLEVEKLVDVTYIPVCSPLLIERHGPVKNPQALARLPLIHDEALLARRASPNWSEWFAAAGVMDTDLSRGLRFTSSDHAMDAAGEGAGVLLAHDIMAYDWLRTGRLRIPVKFALPAGRNFSLVWAKGRKPAPAAEKFRRWIKEEIAALDWRGIRTKLAPRGAS
jgi:LysR family transcriptional regulator, glycine cleavage system transcriptional activator